MTPRLASLESTVVKRPTTDNRSTTNIGAPYQRSVGIVEGSGSSFGPFTTDTGGVATAGARLDSVTFFAAVWCADVSASTGDASALEYEDLESRANPTTRQQACRTRNLMVVSVTVKSQGGQERQLSSGSPIV